MRFAACACLLVALAPAAWAGALPQAVEQALHQAGLPPSSLGVWVGEIGKPAPVLAAGEDRGMHPASAMKLLTTYAALELLGPAYVWKTEIYADGAQRDDTLHGNLFIKGYGDPRLTLENFWLLLRDLRQRGIHHIRGDVVMVQSHFESASGDTPAFDSEPMRAYNARPQALLVNFNAIRFRLLPGENGGLLVTADPAPATLRIVNRIEASNGPCGDWREGIASELETVAGGHAVTLRGRFPLSCGEKSFNLNLLPNGSQVDGVFRLLWDELGGTLSGAVRSGELASDARLLLRFDSPPLAEVVRDINKFSNNVMARQLFLTLGAELSGAPATPDKGAAAITRWLAARGLQFPELVLENGSGLSRRERISPAHLGKLLVTAYRGPMQAEFESSLPIVAVDGTMHKRLRGERVAGQAHIKTGSIDGVRAIAGYLLDARGRRMVVVAMVNHPRAAGARPALDALLQWVYERP